MTKKSKDSGVKKKSKKASAAEDEIQVSGPKKKKKKPRTPEMAAKKLAKQKAKLEAVEEEDLPTSRSMTEKDNYEVYMFLFKRVKKLVKKLEEQCSSGEQVNTRNIYALCTLISSLREIINDIRQIGDTSEHVQQLINGILQPYTSSVAQKILDGFYAQQKLVMSVTKPKVAKEAVRELKSITRDTAKFLQDEHNNAAAKIERLFIEG